MAGDEVGGQDGIDAGSANAGQARERTAGGERAADGEGEDPPGPDSSLGAEDLGVEPVADDVETPAGRRWTLESHDVQFKLPPDASEDEAAAIAAAIGAQLLDERDEAEAAGDEPDGTWDGRRFAFAGRIEGLTGIPRRIPHNAPTDSWTAMSRLDRI